MRELLIVGLLLLSSSEPPRLSVSTYGRYVFAPADWWIKVKVEPHDDNRWLEVSVDGPSFYRRTDFQLEGESSARIRQWWVKSIPEGCYEIVAVLRATGEHGRVLAIAKGPRLAVMGPDSSDPCGDRMI